MKVKGLPWSSICCIELCAHKDDNILDHVVMNFLTNFLDLSYQQCIKAIDPWEWDKFYSV